MNTISHICTDQPKSKQNEAEKSEVTSSVNTHKDQDKPNPLVNSIPDVQKSSSYVLMNPAKKDHEKLVPKSYILQTAKNSLKLQENDNSYFMFKMVRAAFFGAVAGLVLGPWAGVGVFALLAAPSIYEKIKNARTEADKKDTSSLDMLKQDGVELAAKNDLKKNSNEPKSYNNTPVAIIPKEVQSRSSFVFHGPYADPLSNPHATPQLGL